VTISKKNRIKLRRAINTKLAELAGPAKAGEEPKRLLPLDASRAAIWALTGMIDSGEISITFHRNGGEKES
jgi:hypothetical protein